MKCEQLKWMLVIIVLCVLLLALPVYAQRGRYAPPIRTGGMATYVVAASDAGSNLRIRADKKCNGTDDDVQIQAALFLAETTGGIVYLTPGTFSIGTSITMPDSVSLIGAGMTSTILAGDSGLALAMLARSPLSDTIAAYRTSQGSPSIGIVVRDLKIDGIAMPMTNIGQSNATGGKGIQVTFYQDCTFERVWVTNTPSTGFGNDYGQNAKYLSCKATGCGRVGKTTSGATVIIGDDTNEYVCRTSHTSAAENKPGVGVLWKFYWMPTGRTGSADWSLAQGYTTTEPVGNSGFGLGMGGFDSFDEFHFVSNCISNYNFNDGFTFEGVGISLGENIGWGARFIGCSARGNKYGFEITDAGADDGNVWRSMISNCTAIENTSHGIYVSLDSQDIVISDNIVYNNLGMGIYVGHPLAYNISITDNIIRGNQLDGITSLGSNIVIDGNIVSGNLRRGIFISSATLSEVHNVIISNNTVVNNSNGSATHPGLRIESLNSQIISKIEVSGNIFSNVFHQSDIDSITGDGTTVTVVTVRDHLFNWGDRVVIAGTSNHNGNPAGITIIGPKSFTFASATSDTEATGTATLDGNFGNRNGIQLMTTSANIENLSVVGNVIVGSIQPELAVSGANISNWIFANNVGYITENGGAAASVADGGTIAHGLSETPSYAIAIGTIAGEIVTITSLDGSNITVAIKDNDDSTGTTQTIHWRAVYQP